MYRKCMRAALIADVVVDSATPIKDTVLKVMGQCGSGGLSPIQTGIVHRTTVRKQGERYSAQKRSG